MFYTPEEINAITQIIQAFSLASNGPFAVAARDALTRVRSDDLSLNTLFIFRCVLFFGSHKAVSEDVDLKPHVDTALEKTTSALKAMREESPH
jgi:hypothetical protein